MNNTATKPYRELFASDVDYAKSRERGRSLAAASMIQNPEARERVEAKYGVEQCKLQYPEVYGLDAEPQLVLP